MVRTGFPGVHAYGFDDLLYEYGVDISFWAHEHSYERTFPVYNMTVMNGTGSAYKDPGATVHIINGAAGNRWVTAQSHCFRIITYQKLPPITYTLLS